MAGTCASCAFVEVAACHPKPRLYCSWFKAFLRQIHPCLHYCRCVEDGQAVLGLFGPDAQSDFQAGLGVRL